jgi:hypothetical protein
MQSVDGLGVILTVFGNLKHLECESHTMTETEKRLIPEGTYIGTVKEFKSITQSPKGAFVLPIAVKIEQWEEPVHVYMAGYLPIVYMALAAKDFFIGKQYLVRIRHQKIDRNIYYSVDILWGEVK